MRTRTTRLSLVVLLAVISACSVISSTTASESPVPITSEPEPSSTVGRTTPTALEPDVVPTEGGSTDDAGAEYPVVLDGSVTITVRWVLDGDSIEADTPWGNVEVRLLGVNANERDECFGTEAKDALIERLDHSDAQLWVEIHETYGPDRDEYGRLLGYVWQQGRLVNLDQIADGYALARSAFGHPLQAAFDAAESNARDEQVGLWSPTACGSAASAQIVIGDLRFDADGRDDENPNGEWIDLRNESSDQVDLTDWLIRDESTRHRYRFPTDFVLAPGASVRLRSGCGTDDLSADPIELFWCGPYGPVWSNSGDTAIVQDPQGNIVASQSYESIYD